ncbi:MAG: hypothetical protein ACOY3Z_03215 [Thermodesulfobacteriota bacterium]
MTPEPVLKPYQEKIISLMIRQETLLATLYQSFARQFPEYEAFWNKLSLEERKHAGWLEQLRDATAKKVVLFSEGRIKTYTLETLVKGVEEKLRRAEAGGFDLRQAMACTVDLERALLEKNIFSHFVGMTTKAENVMKFLAQETQAHQTLAQQLQDEICRRASGKP